MSINLNKPEESSSGNTGGGNVNMDALFTRAVELKGQGTPDYQIEQLLMNEGADKATATQVLQQVNRMIAERQGQSDYNTSGSSSGGGGGIPRILIYILILGGINLLSALFDWGFWIY